MEAAVLDRPNLQLLGLVALVVAMAFYDAAASAQLHAKKGPAHKPPPQQAAPPTVRYIRCAMELGEGPCGRDPAMQRLNAELPESVRPAPSFDQRYFAPER
jgi:hypothetical protein